MIRSDHARMLFQPKTEDPRRPGDSREELQWCLEEVQSDLDPQVFEGGGGVTCAEQLHRQTTQQHTGPSQTPTSWSACSPEDKAPPHHRAPGPILESHTTPDPHLKDRVHRRLTVSGFSPARIEFQRQNLSAHLKIPIPEQRGR